MSTPNYSNLPARPPINCNPTSIAILELPLSPTSVFLLSAGNQSLPLSPAGERPRGGTPPASVLSIQSDILGNRTYALILRDCFARFGDLVFDSVWYKEDRSLATKILHRFFSYPLPLVGGIHRNLDLSRIRTELSYGRTARLLLERRLRSRRYDIDS